MFQSTSLSMDEWINLEQGQKEFSLLKPDFQLPEYIHLMTVENWDAPSTDVNADMQGSLFEGYRQLVGCSLICQTDLIYNFNNHFLCFNLKQKQLFKTMLTMYGSYLEITFFLSILLNKLPC